MKSSDETKQGPLGSTQFLGDRFLSCRCYCGPRSTPPQPASGTQVRQVWEDPQASARVREAPEAKWQELLQLSPRTLSPGAEMSAESMA